MYTLSGNIFQVTSELNNGFRSTGLGFSVEESCFSKWGDGFTNILKLVKKDGFSCLKNKVEVDPSGHVELGVSRNIKSLTGLLNKDDKVKIVCDDLEYEYGWNSTLAYASTDRRATLKGYENVKHPFISIRPTNYKGNPSPDDIEKIKRSIFHELFHSLDYGHGDNIDYAYACGICCFEGGTIPQKSNACKICRGDPNDYKDHKDIKYVKDHVDLILNKDENLGYMAIDIVQGHLKENEKSVDCLIEYARANSSSLNTIGTDLSSIMMMNFTNTLIMIRNN